MADRAYGGPENRVGRAQHSVPKRQTTGLVVCGAPDCWSIVGLPATGFAGAGGQCWGVCPRFGARKWTCNADGRQAVFHHKTPRSRRYTATFIDQGYCFNAGEWTFPDYPLRGVYATNCVYQGVKGWEAFEPALTRAEEMDADAIWRCAAEIPEEWY